MEAAILLQDHVRLGLVYLIEGKQTKPRLREIVFRGLDSQEDPRTIYFQELPPSPPLPGDRHSWSRYEIPLKKGPLRRVDEGESIEAAVYEEALKRAQEHSEKHRVPLADSTQYSKRVIS